MITTKERQRAAITLVCLLALVLVMGAMGYGTDGEGGPWQTEIGRDHALTGRIWDAGRGEFIGAAGLVERITEGRFVLLGEKHDNPDHHRLQAWLVKRLAAAGRRVSVAFEMFGTETGTAIEKHLAEQPGDADGLAAAVNWKESGWPDWAMYRPIAEAAVEGKLTIVAANLPRETTRALGREGLGALDTALVERYELRQPLDPAVQSAMEEEIREAHCGMANDAMVAAMIAVQRARDATMAESTAAGDRGDGSVLIAGTGHARTDRGVPVYLRMHSPGGTVRSLGFLEVDKDKSAPEDYAANFHAQTLPFDFVWFTPRVDDLDPCEKYRERLKEMQKND